MLRTNRIFRAFSSISLVEHTPGIKTLLLSSPPVNTLTLPVLESLNEHLIDLATNNPKGLVICSTLKNTSAGLDLNYLVKQATETPDEFKARITYYMNLFQNAILLLVSAPYPTAAIVRGAAPAGGTVISLACDYRIAAKESPLLMGLTEVQVGMAPPRWVHELAINALGPRAAAKHIQMGTIVNDAQTANSFGYLDKLIDTSAKDVAMDQAPSQLDTSAQVLYHEAIRYLSAAGKLPWTARTDAKLKSNSGIINNVNQAGLKAVVESIAGKEFQLTASTMLIALKNRKK